ncbi:MAG TPA: dTDP-4-dehydrorhamnose reductase [Clostridia bacterium]|nr:dTDP-4-dehydrorhamnose reductase [Clostridia bacterium]
MKVLVTGANGQLGSDVVKELKSRKMEFIGVDIKDFDITDYDKTLSFITKQAPDAVIHCAAYTAVDKAEDEPEKCHLINDKGSENVACACAKLNAKMVYMSTDYVFSGDGTEPFEGDAPKSPLNEYGKSKLNGELSVQANCEKSFIVRTSWVFGLSGGNFVKTMIKLGKEKGSINVVCDQVGSPTYTKDLAVLLCDMIKTNKFGVYHATNEGFCSWADFAQEIMNLAKLNAKITPIPTSEYKTKATRPLNSRLSKVCLEDAGFNTLPSWINALKRYIDELKNE